MKHGILLFSLLVLLTGTAGGVFVLVQEGGTGQEIAEEILTASVSAGEKLEEEKAFESKPTAKQIAPSPIAPKPPVPPPVALTSTSTSPLPNPAPQPSLTRPPPPPAGKININIANYEELQEIIGVGPVIAQRIIDYRSQNGQFQKIEDLKNVSGIGDVTFEKMKDEITI